MMAKVHPLVLLLVISLCVLIEINKFLISPTMAKPTTFLQDFHITWSEAHIKQLNKGTAIQLLLDQSSGCGFASKNKYMYGRVSMKIKLIPGDSAGTVTAFYMNSDTNGSRDELDFEFLGNRSGQPYTVQTNVFANGKGDREQRVNLWFDPSSQFHTFDSVEPPSHCYCLDQLRYKNCVGCLCGMINPLPWSKGKRFYVDEVPIRVYKNNEAKRVPYPKSQPMGIYSTLWEADNWATRGGLEKIDWSKAPFYAYYKDFDIEGCTAGHDGRAAGCSANNSSNWWEAPSYQQLNPIQARNYRWVRLNHMVYDYCTDKSRNPVAPPECLAGI
ncbi:Glycoside hydrolase [Macleaya cordata]|uniref:Xyloglucan endotransglucosylase/hydrolase n=1 Tax=Macleaya cordata TaxID=56857 RepID=A0A200R096_MACCD|nr:Glycoside hydrolase [Macleaya cordata]